jgi:serine/threonine protein kinase
MAKSGEQIGTYVLETHLGSGGNGEVWRARAHEQVVALKILRKRSQPDGHERFRREILALHRLRGIQGIIPLLDSGMAGDLPWFTMPIADPMKSKLTETATISEIASAFAAIAGALSRIHTMGLSHRDIKPDNLFWYSNEWCLGDFGLVDFEGGPPLTEDGKKLGPAHYIAPEMLNSAASANGARADIYSLGKTLWVIAAGQNYPIPGPHDPSFQGMSIATLRAEAGTRGIDELLRRMTALDPAARPSAATVAEELLSVVPLSRTVLPPPTADGILKMVRDAVAPQISRQAKEARALEFVGRLRDLLREEVTAIGREIHVKTGLDLHPARDIPSDWKLSDEIGTPVVANPYAIVFFCRAGEGDWAVELSIGFCCNLLGSNELHVHAGYNLNRLYRGGIQSQSYGGWPRTAVWSVGKVVPNETTTSELAVMELREGLRFQLPNALQAFMDGLESIRKMDAR